jgi:hypothetical protein
MKKEMKNYFNIFLFSGVVDTAGKHSFANISENLRKKI